ASFLPVSKFCQVSTTWCQSPDLKPTPLTHTIGAAGSDSAIPFCPSGTAGNTPMRRSRGLASLKSNQLPPLFAPFRVIWNVSQKPVMNSLLGSVLIQTDNEPPQPPFL